MIQRADDAKVSQLFTAKGIAFLELMADINDTRKQGEKAIAVGLTPAYASRLKHTPEFSEALIRRTRENVRTEIPAVYGALVERALAGDVQACATVLKASGEIQTGVNVTTNVTQTNAADALTERLERHHEARFKRIPSDT